MAVVRQFYLLATSKGDRIDIQSSVPQKTGRVTAFIHYLVNYTLNSSLPLATLTPLHCGSRQAHGLLLCLQNTVLHFSI